MDILNNLNKYGIQLIKQSDTGNRVFLYEPANNRLGIGNAKVREITDPQTLVSLGVNLSSLPTIDTSKNNILSSAGGTSNIKASGIQDLLNNYQTNDTNATTNEQALIASNKALGSNAFTGSPSDYATSQDIATADANSLATKNGTNPLLSNPPISSLMQTSSQSTSVAPTVASLNSIGNLSLNSTDSAGVKALQTFLNSQGANLTVDGKFGNLTQQAVKDFQTQNGLTADGVVGPKTQAVINKGNNTNISSTPVYDTSTGFLIDYGKSIGATPTQPNDPANISQSYNTSSQNTQNNLASTGNPEIYSALANIQTLIDNMSKTGQIPAGLQITDAVTSQFLQAAHNVVDPYTQQQIKGAVSDLNASLANQGTQFNAQQGQITQDFGTNLATEQNQAGRNGTAFSGQRALNETNLANTTNRSLASLGANTAYNIGNTLRTGAGQVGANNTGQFNTPSLNLNSVGITGGQRGNVSNYGSLAYNYNPSQYTVGSLTDTGTANVGNTYANYLNRYNQLAANQSNSSRTWQDLANQAINTGNIGSQ